MLWQVTKQTSSWNSDRIRILIILQGAADLIRRGEEEERRRRKGKEEREEGWMEDAGSSATQRNATSFVIYLSGNITQCMWKGESEMKALEIKRGWAVSILIYGQ